MINQFHQKLRSFGHYQSRRKLELLLQAEEARKNIALSGYVIYNDGSFDGLEMINDEVNQRADLNYMGEEPDS